MPHHVVVDGSNLATEGRALPSLAQLNDAVTAFMEEHPDALITVVVDATFGHRIDQREVAEFDEAVANNEVVAPPAGAIGRGDAFLLGIAHKVGATVLSNDSFQEFHGQYTWLFDEGRLIGGKPVPHIGWVFVNRVPVRGPISRSAVKEAKRRKDGGAPLPVRKRRGSAAASAPMPVPKAPPPGAVLPGASAPAPAPAAAAAAKVDSPAPAKQARQEPAAPKATQFVNDFPSFLSFLEHHPIGTSVNAIVESYSSHGAYVRLGDVVGYVPLRLMADPAPRSAREFLKIGDAVTLVVESFAPARRSIDLAIVGMATAAPPAAPAAPARRTRKKAAPTDAASGVAEPVGAPTDGAADAPAPAPAKRSRAKKAAPPAEPVAAPADEGATGPAEAPAPAPAKRSRAKKAAPPAEPAAAAGVDPAAEAGVAPPEPGPAKRAPARAPRAPRTKAAAAAAPAAPAEDVAAAGATDDAPDGAATPARRRRARATPAAASDAGEATAAGDAGTAAPPAQAPPAKRSRAARAPRKSAATTAPAPEA